MDKMLLRLVFGLLTAAYLSKAQEEKIEAFGLNTNALPWKSPTWIQKSIRLPEESNHLTVCFCIKILFEYSTNIGITSLSSDMGIIVDDQNTAMLLGQDMPLYLGKMVPWRWNHICATYGSYPQFFIDGIRSPGKIEALDSQIVFSGEYNATIGIPADRTHKGLYTPFAGYVTQFRIFNRNVTEEEVMKLASNEELPDENLADGEWQVLGSNSEVITTVFFNQTHSTVLPPDSDYKGFDVIEEVTSDVYLPRQEYEYQLIKGPAKFEEVREICDIMKGSIPLSDDKDFQQAMQNVGSKHQEPIIVNESTLLGLLVCAVPSNPEFRCSILYFKPFEEMPVQMDDDCDAQCLYITCKVNTNLTFELRQDNFPTVREKFHLIPHGVLPRFFSTEGKEILITGSHSKGVHLELRWHPSNRTIATARIEGIQPFGRHLWNFKETNTTEQMVLTTCSEEEFTCKSGSCLNLTKRCDGENDCGDDSDEDCSLLQPLPHSYRSYRPHKRWTPVDIALSIIDIASIDVDHNTIRLHFEIITTWQDDRVHLLQLKDNEEENLLPNDKVWYPALTLNNAIFEDNVAFSKKKGVRQRLNAHRISMGKPLVSKSYEGYIYRAGSEAYLNRTEDFVASFKCTFNLKMYPFDNHICEAHFEISQIGSYLAYFNTSAMSLRTSKIDLPLYVNWPFCYIVENNKENISSFKIQILLQRQYGAYVFTTFLPGLFLGIIGISSQWFELHNFTDRIMVTLSCLIVIAALFSQVAVTVPASATPKFIDVYFFFFVIRLFYIFLHHVILFLLMRKAKDTTETKVTKLYEGTFLKTIPPNDIADILTGKATYIPPSKTYQPQCAWYETQRNQGKLMKKKRKSCFVYFNIVSITLGFVLDVLWWIVGLYMIADYYNRMLSEFGESCTIETDSMETNSAPV